MEDNKNIDVTKRNKNIKKIEDNADFSLYKVLETKDLRNEKIDDLFKNTDESSFGALNLVQVPSIKTIKQLKEKKQEEIKEDKQDEENKEINKNLQTKDLKDPSVLPISFFPSWSAISKELENYKPFFKDKVIFCNYNDGLTSNFVRYFITYFKELAIKELIATDFYGNEIHLKRKTQNINEDELNDDLINTFNLENTPFNKDDTDLLHLLRNDSFTDDNFIIMHLKHDHPLIYNDEISLKLFKTADVIVSMPHQDDFIDYITLIMNYNKENEDNKRFITIGLQNNVFNPELLKYFRLNTIRTGFYYLSGLYYKHEPDYFYDDENTRLYHDFKENKSFNNLIWFTNCLIDKEDKTQRFYEDNANKDKTFLKFDNTDILSIPSIDDIPNNSYEKMGVPVGFINYYVIDKPFKIIGELSSKYTKDNPYFLGKPILKQKQKPDRLVIQRQK